MGTFHFPWIFIIKRNKKKMANKQEIIPVTFKADNIFDISDNAATLAYQKSSAYTDGQITTVDNNISTISATVSSISSTVSSVKETVDTNSGNIKTLQGNVSTLQEDDKSIKSTVASHTSSINTLNGKVTNNTTNISNLTQTASGIQSTVESLKTSVGDNLFSFKEAEFSDYVYPFIQGYGVGLLYNSSNKLWRISNLGFDNQTGDYTVSFDVYCWGGSKLNVNLCDVQANGYNGDSTITVPTGKYTHYDFRFTIPDSNTYVSPTSYNGFLDFENFDKNMLIKNLNITRGTIPSEVTYSQKDINDIDSNQQYTGWTFNNTTTSTEMIDGMNRTVYTKSYIKTSGITDVIYMNGITLKQDRSYTLSFYAKGQGNLLAYLYPHSMGVDFSRIESPTVAGTTSKNLRSDGETFYKLDATWRKFVIHFYNQSLDSLNCICVRIPENTENFTLYVSDPVLEEGFITDTFDATKSLIRQSADEILEQVGDTYIKIGDGNITLNGSTQVNGTLTLNDNKQGFLLINGNNVCQISPKSLPSYTSFSNAASISRNYAVNWYEVDGHPNTTTDLFFGYHFSDSIGDNFKVGDTINFGNLYHSMMTGRFGGGQTINNCKITFKVLNSNNALYSIDSSNQTNIDIPNQTVKYDGNVSITIDIAATVTNSIYYGSDTPTSSTTPKAYVNWSLGVTTPTRNTFLQISPDGMAVNFGTNKNVYIGNDGFYANFGSYNFRITADGVMGNNVHRTQVYTTSQTIPDGVDCAIFTGSGNLTATLPSNPYEGQTIKIADKCNNLYLVSTKPVMQQNSRTANILTGTQHELGQAFWWEYIYSNGTWYEMVMGN